MGPIPIVSSVRQMRLADFADKVEDAISSHQHAKAVSLCEKAVSEVQKVFDAFRPLLSKGYSEVEGLGDVSKPSKDLLRAIRDVDTDYKTAIKVTQSKDSDTDRADAAKNATHSLSMAVSDLKAVFNQFVKSYGSQAPLG